ncbi:MAG: NYN domain-containing protein [Acidimicrobiales bacterium]
MPPTNVVVDGSNIATEGRSTPSLEQLDQAVRQYLDEHPGTNVTVVVDASFGHRIEPSERHAFEEAVAHGELVSPPAGAIGRGDAFLLRIAERIGARVLSNDSFREFHAEHPWLFDQDRLVGGTPVPGVGWIFTPRRPVRGPLTPATGNGGRRAAKGAGGERAEKPDKPEKGDKSQAGKRELQGAAAKSTKVKKAKKAEVSAAARGEKDEVERRQEGEPTTSRRRGRGRTRGSDQSVEAAIAQATEEALVPGEAAKKGGTKRRDSGGAAPEAVNDPLPFITFASEHPVGSQLEGTIVSFTSHGAMAQVEDMLCYVPLAGLGDPPPRRARDVVRQGETRVFELVALDPARRGAQLALPEVVATHREIAEGPEEAASEVRRRRKKAPTAEVVAPRKKAAGSKEAAPAKKTAGSAKSVAVRKAPRTIKKAASTKKAAPASKAEPTRKSEQTKKSEATKKPAPAKRELPAKKASPSKKAPPSKKAAAARKVVQAKKAGTAKKVLTFNQAVPANKSATANKSTTSNKSATATKAARTKKAATAGKAVAGKKVPTGQKTQVKSQSATSRSKK